MKTFSKRPGNERRKTISCPLCGSTEFREIWKGKGPFVKCGNCGSVYQNPQPVQEDLLGRYDEEYLEYEIENEKKFFGLMKLGLADIGFSEIEAELQGDKGFMDVGCATGMLLKKMKDRGWETKGIEVCAPAAKWGIEHRGLDIHIGTLESAGIEENSFDVIHCSHVIEHLTSPREFVEEVFRILKPGGYFIVTTPNIDGFQAKVFKYSWRSAIEDHMVLFSRNTLSDILRRTGFSICRTKTWGGLAVGAGFSFIKPLVDRWAKRFGFGDVVIILAQKEHSGDIQV